MEDEMLAAKLHAELNAESSKSPPVVPEADGYAHKATLRELVTAFGGQTVDEGLLDELSDQLAQGVEQEMVVEQLLAAIAGETTAGQEDEPAVTPLGRNRSVSGQSQY